MNHLQLFLSRVLFTTTVFLLANFSSLSKIEKMPALCILLVVLFIIMQIHPAFATKGLHSKRLRFLANGAELLMIFTASALMTFIWNIMGFIGKLPIGSIREETTLWIANLIISIIIEALVFWNGIIRVYTSSEQLGIKTRVVGIICGWIPIAHLVALFYIIHIVNKEVIYENEWLIRNEERSSDEICKTKYPILLIHGVFFRDFKYLNYWGRIPKGLEENGAKIYYGEQPSADSVASCGAILARRIEQIVKETGCEKVNIIAHSKGGLDSRYAITKGGVGHLVASLTTINTPHKGCIFADYLLDKIPQKQQETIAAAYNKALSKVGDVNPDFIKAVNDLTASACETFNEEVQNRDEVYYQSFGSKLNHATSGRFPLNISYKLVKHFDGENDGLVGEESFAWGDHYEYLTVNGLRGISHGDMIDLNRENLEEFDVREFYVQLVADLKKRGY